MDLSSRLSAEDVADLMAAVEQVSTSLNDTIAPSSEQPPTLLRPTFVRAATLVSICDSPLAVSNSTLHALSGDPIALKLQLEPSAAAAWAVQQRPGGQFEVTLTGTVSNSTLGSLDAVMAHGEQWFNVSAARCEFRWQLTTIEPLKPAPRLQLSDCSSDDCSVDEWSECAKRNFKQGDWSQAITSFTHCVRSTQGLKQSLARSGRSLAFSRAGRPCEGMQDGLAALAGDCRNVRAGVRAAAAMVQMGNLRQAQHLLRKLELLTAHLPPTMTPHASVCSVELSPAIEQQAIGAAAYQLHVSLVGTRVWRRLLVPNHLTLMELHLVLNSAVGWDNRCTFSIVTRNGTCFSPRDIDHCVACDPALVPVTSVLLAPADELLYVYDMAAGWKHRVRLEAIRSTSELGLSSNVRWPPSCIGGEFACPPEEVAGLPGYAKFVLTVTDRNHPELREKMLWASAQVGDTNMACVGALQWLQSSDDLPHEQCTWNDAAFSPHVVTSALEGVFEAFFNLDNTQHINSSETESSSEESDGDEDALDGGSQLREEANETAAHAEETTGKDLDALDHDGSESSWESVGFA